MTQFPRGTIALMVAFAAAVPLAAQALATADSAPAPWSWTNHVRSVGGPRLASLRLGIDPAGLESTDTLRRRQTKAIELSDAYAIRLKIHQIASFAELPIFAAEILVGQKLAKDRDAGLRSSGALRGAHSALAAGLGVLFGVNTITGTWNLVEGWKDPKGRTRRLIHSVAMLAADAGFLATAGTVPDNDRFEGRAGGGSSVSTHRMWAISASSVATAATLMMWLWKD